MTMQIYKDYPSWEKVDRNLDRMYYQYCPFFGPSKTVGGEIVRALSRILFRWATMKEKIGKDKSVETAARWLQENANQLKVYYKSSKYLDGGEGPQNRSYEYTIYEDADHILQALEKNMDLFSTPTDMNIDL